MQPQGRWMCGMMPCILHKGLCATKQHDLNPVHRQNPSVLRSAFRKNHPLQGAEAQSLKRDSQNEQQQHLTNGKIE